MLNSGSSRLVRVLAPTRSPLPPAAHAFQCSVWRFVLHLLCAEQIKIDKARAAHLFGQLVERFPEPAPAPCAGEIQDLEIEMTLRIRSHLLKGLTKIYTHKVQVRGLLVLPHSG